jgi:hypothetical protein
MATGAGEGSELKKKGEGEKKELEEKVVRTYKKQRDGRDKKGGSGFTQEIALGGSSVGDKRGFEEVDEEMEHRGKKKGRVGVERVRGELDHHQSNAGLPEQSCEDL